MVSLTYLFFLNIILFSIIGAMRGWAKEILVSFSVVLTLFIITVAERFVPILREFLAGNLFIQFWFRAVTLIVLLIFGYQTPNLPALQRDKRGDLQGGRVQDSLLGFFLGALNGYLIVGTLWFFLDYAAYPFDFISAPGPTDPNLETTQQILRLLPPVFIDPPLVYILLAVFAVFILVLVI